VQAEARPGIFSAYDVPLLFAVLFLVGIGIVMVYSASSAVASERFGSDAFFLKRQAVYSLIGIVALVAYAIFPSAFCAL
jgi:cell division protein FtsW